MYSPAEANGSGGAVLQQQHNVHAHQNARSWLLSLENLHDLLIFTSLLNYYPIKPQPIPISSFWESNDKEALVLCHASSYLQCARFPWSETITA